MAADTKENRTKQDIKAALVTNPALRNVRLFANPSGTAKVPLEPTRSIGGAYRYINYGLGAGTKGLATLDFIGWRTIVITQDMVGLEIAQFMAVDAKAPGKHLTDDQTNFAAMVNLQGGIAFEAHSGEELHNKIWEYYRNDNAP